MNRDHQPAESTRTVSAACPQAVPGPDPMNLGGGRFDATPRTELIRLLRPEIERVCRLMEPCFARFSLRVDWAPSPPAHSALCAACIRRSLSLSPLDTTCSPPCCACVHGYWRAWLPIIVQTHLCAVISLESQAGHPEGRVRRRGVNGHLDADRQRFIAALDLAVALLAGAMAIALVRSRQARIADVPCGSVGPPPQSTGEQQLNPSGSNAPATSAAGGLAATPNNPFAALMLKAIREEFGDPLTLKELAQRLRRSPLYLSGLFTHEVGIPFKRCLTEHRLAEARRLLEDPVRSVAEVADAVGYSNDQRFRAAFKQAIGVSPSKWRAQHYRRVR